MIHLLFAAALLQSPADPCNAATLLLPPTCPHGWRFVDRGIDETDIDHASVMSFDPVTLRRDGHYVEADVRTLREQDLGDHIRSTIQHMRIDCTERTTATLSLSAYAADGSLIVQSALTGPDAAPRRWGAATLGGRLMAMVC